MFDRPHGGFHHPITLTGVQKSRVGFGDRAKANIALAIENH
jgi:hypothetical protein